MILMDPTEPTPESTTVDEDDEVMSLFELIMGNIDMGNMGNIGNIMGNIDAMDYEFESEKLVVTEGAAPEEEEDSEVYSVLSDLLEVDSGAMTTTTTGSSDSERPKVKGQKRSKRTNDD